MVATQFTGSERRALRWMRGRGLGLYPTPVAFDILAARLDVRFRAGLVAWTLFFVFYVVWLIRTSPDYPDTSPLWSRVGRVVVPVLVYGVAFTVFTVWCRRGDRTIVRSMPTRVTRTGAVPVRMVLGPLAVWVLAVTLAVYVVVTSLLATRASTADAVAFGFGVVAVGTIVAIVLRSVLHRPTVALDTSALAVDERLRALDALIAVGPFGWVGLALLGSIDLRGVAGAGLIVGLTGIAFVVGSGVMLSHPAEQVRYGLGRFRRHA